MLIDQPADGLAVPEHERHLVAPHLEHRPAAGAAGRRMAEAGIEKTRVMDAEFADQRIEGRHFRGIVGRHMHRFAETRM